MVVEAAQEADAEGAEAKREADAFLAKGQALQWMHTKIMDMTRALWCFQDGVGG